MIATLLVPSLVLSLAPAPALAPATPQGVSKSSEDGVRYGGHVRLRVESWGDFNFGAPPGVSHTDVFTLGRIIAFVDAPLVENLRVFLEGKGAWATDRDLPGGTRTLDEDAIDLQQGYLQYLAPLGDSGTKIKAGRLQLSLGAQRLVSPLPWGNTLRHWDGVHVQGKVGDWGIQGFATNFAPVDPDRFDRRDEGTKLHGIYSTHPLGANGKSGIDLYALRFERDAAMYNGTAGEEERTTLGARWFRPKAADAQDADVELAYQFGSVGSGDVQAFMLGAVTGWTAASGDWRVWAGLDYATGDRGTGGDVETFQQMFPLGHAYLGLTDTIGRQNIADLSIGVDLGSLDSLETKIALHTFRLADEDDALYNAGGGAIRPAGTSTNRGVGNELSVVLRKAMCESTTAEVGAARFFAGDVIEDSVASEDIDFLYFQLLFRF